MVESAAIACQVNSRTCLCQGGLLDATDGIDSVECCRQVGQERRSSKYSSRQVLLPGTTPYLHDLCSFPA